MMTVPKLLLPLFVITAVLGSVLVGIATGDWQVSGKTMIDVNSMTSADEIKGWMTIQQVSTGLNIDLDTLYAVMGIPTDIAPETAMKDLEGIVEGFETSTVRERVAAYLETGEIPAPLESEEPAAETTPETTPAPTATPAPAEVHEPAGEGPGTGADDGEGIGPTPLPPGAYLAAADIKGQTTLKEIIVNGQVEQEALLAALGLNATTNLNTKAKDLIGKGIIVEVQIIRDVVAELQKK